MANEALATSTLGIDLIKHFEDFEAEAYQDSGGVWTIGYGTTKINRIPVKKGMRCTEDEALEWLADDVIGAEKSVHTLTKVTLKQHQFDALVSFTYNCGAGNLHKSTLLKKINWNESVEQRHFTDYNKARVNGILTPLKGLTRRRKAEYYLFHFGTLQFHF